MNDKYSSGVLGRYGQLIHWGPLIALGIISSVSTMAIQCDLMWWPPTSSVWAALNLIVFLSWIMLTLNNFFNACFVGPGFVPLGWKPVIFFLQYILYSGTPLVRPPPPLAPEMCPFKMGGLSSGVEINTFMFRSLTMSCELS